MRRVWSLGLSLSVSCFYRGTREEDSSAVPQYSVDDLNCLQWTDGVQVTWLREEFLLGIVRKKRLLGSSESGQHCAAFQPPLGQRDCVCQPRR